MTPQRITVADTAPQPWRNGGGSTRELLAWPSAAHWRLRLSVADIDTDGPFSVFDGVQRWFVVLQGAGVALSIAGRAHAQRLADAPLCFDGAARTDCRLLDGPTRDLNLMLRQAAGGLLPAWPGQPWRPPGPVCGLFTRVPGHCRALASAGAAPSSMVQPTMALPEMALPAMALLWFNPAPAELAWQADPVLAGTADTPARAWWFWASHESTST